ncbi:MAG: hypothetical protein ACO1SX_14300 [Actinomycetota bacterium]
MGWVLFHGHWIIAPVALSVAPLLAALSVWNACRGCAPGVEGADSFYFHRAMVFVAAAVGVIALLVMRDTGPWICSGLGLLLCAMNVWFTVRVFQEYERRFEVSRTIDADLESD